VTTQSDHDRLDEELVDAFGDLFGHAVQQMEAVANRFDLPPFCVKALHMLSSPMAMKELGRKFHCDPSFVTAIADQLDSRGLGVRETDPHDRRIKNLVLTPRGLELRQQLESELSASMLWTSTLDVGERQCLLALLRKMTGGTSPAGEVTDELKPAARSGS
jgi:DNA-binding MarR family transcriptional regulator